MSLKTNTEQLCSREIICKTAKEQPVELDYILPDYYPEIFRVIRCTACPTVTACSVNGDRLTYELSVELKVIYCGGSGMNIRTVERRMNYSGSVDLEDNGMLPAAKVVPSVEYINCRAVTGRRIDIHGAVSVSITVTAEKLRSVISDVFGCGVLLKKREMTCPSPEIYAEKRVTVSEKIDMGSDKPPISDILRCSAIVLTSENKAIANKLAVKGDIKVNLLCTCRGDADETAQPEAMQFTMPYSQIMDMDGLDERYDVRSSVTVSGCELRPVSDDGSGEAHSVECEVILLITCTGERYSEISAAADEFSTVCATSHKTENIRIPCRPRRIEQTRTVKGTAEQHDGTIDRVYDAWCEVTACDTIREEDGSLTAVGKALLCCMLSSGSGEPVISTADVPFRFENIGGESCSPDAVTDIEAVPLSVSYSLTSDNTAEIKAELRFSGEIRDRFSFDAITEITADEEAPLTADSDVSVKLYFAKKGEDLWETAKRCRTSPAEIMEENGLDSEIMSEDGMIVIPIVR